MSLNRLVDVDATLPDGSDGTIHNNAWLQLLQDRIDARWFELSITLTGSQNNVSLVSASREADVLRCNNATDLTITGIAAPVSPAKPGKLLIIVSVGAGNVFLAHQSASSTAENRLINFATSAVTPLAAGSGNAVYEYDDTTDRWRLVSHDQGAWLTPTFAAGNYTGNGSMTWTVEAGDVSTSRYWLRGRTLTYGWSLATTTVGGTLGQSLQIGNGAWGGFTGAATQIGAHSYIDNGGTEAIGRAAGGGTVIAINKAGLGNWAASTNVTSTSGQITFDVT